MSSDLFKVFSKEYLEKYSRCTFCDNDNEKKYTYTRDNKNDIIPYDTIYLIFSMWCPKNLTQRIPEGVKKISFECDMNINKEDIPSSVTTIEISAQ